jgi:drug/metabolite transporter (DMT)-like permease
LIGLGLGIAGVVMLVGLDLGHLHAWSLVEVAIVVIGYTVAPAIMVRSLSDLPSIPVVSASLLLAAVGYLPYAVIRPPHSLDAQEISSIAVLGLVCTALAFVLFFALINDIGPARATVITYVNPAVAVLFGVVLLDERFTLGMAIGFPLILAGSVLAARRKVAPDPGVPEAVLCEVVLPDQSMRTDPAAVSNTAATSPVPSSSGVDQSTAIPSSGC